MTRHFSLCHGGLSPATESRLQIFLHWLSALTDAVTFQPTPRSWASQQHVDILSSSCRDIRNEWALRGWTKLGSCQCFGQWEQAKQKAGGRITVCKGQHMYTYLKSISLLLDNSLSHPWGRFQQFKIQKNQNFFSLHLTSLFLNPPYGLSWAFWLFCTTLGEWRRCNCLEAAGRMGWLSAPPWWSRRSQKVTVNKAWSSIYRKESVKPHSFLINTLWGSPLIHLNTLQMQAGCAARAVQVTHPVLSLLDLGWGLPECRSTAWRGTDTCFQMSRVALLTPSRLALPSLAHVPGHRAWTQNSALAIKGYLRWNLSLLGGELFKLSLLSSDSTTSSWQNNILKGLIF